MPLTKRSLVLPASPPSVKLARFWVSKVLEEIGREDLVDAAQLGVSELVTNALIHSHPPLSVRVRGTVDHPRIEVVDSSPVPPQRAAVAPETGRGRRRQRDHVRARPRSRRDDVQQVGLGPRARRAQQVGLVRAHRRCARFEAQLEGEIFDFDPALAEGPEPFTGPRVRLRLLARAGTAVRRAAPLPLRGTPRAAPPGDDRARRVPDRHRDHRDLRPGRPGTPRRGRRLATGPGDQRRRGGGGPGVQRACVGTPATMARIRDLLDEVYRVFSEDHLLALRPPDLLVELQNWYFTEFERQGNGEEPIPWTGPTSMPPA